MNTRTSAFRRLAILSLSALAFAACDNKTTSVVTPLDPQVTITPSAATLSVGQTTQFIGQVTSDTTGSLSGVNYSSSNTAVATVSATGVVTAVAPGSAAIIATSKFRATRSAAATVTVTPVVSFVTIAVAPSSATLNPGQTLNLVTSVGGTTNTAVTFVSSDTSVAKVSAAGVVTATTKNGIAVITATSAADATKSASSTITVTGGFGVGTTVITISPASATVDVGGTFTFVATVTGNANTAKTFTSSDITVATVNATTGVVTATNKAGTSTITATSTADPSKTASATIIVVRPTVTVTASPTTVTISPQQTTTITSTITGSAADIAAGVTCSVSAADAAVATVTSPGCVVTGVAAGTATVVVRSVGDPTKTALVTVNVAAVTQPSISIQSVTIAATPPATGTVPVAPGATVTGNMTVVLNVSAGSATSIQRVAVRLGGVEACSQTFNPPLAPTQGVASITCVVNTAQLNPTTGQAIFSNGTYLLTADAFSTASSVTPVATATYGNIVLANTNTANGVVTYDNTLSDADNTPTSTPQIAAGVVWNGGSATVTVTTAVFTGTPAANIQITQDLNCDGTTAGEVTKTAVVTNGTASATFSEAAASSAAPTGGNDDVQQAAVCYLVGGATAANTTAITFPAGNGRGQVSTVGTAPATVAAGAQAVDNVEPVFAIAPTLPAAVLANNNYAGANTTFSSATVQNGTATDAGVGGVTYSFFAVPAGTAVGSQAAMRTAVTGQTAITSASQLPSSSISNSAYILIERAMDALGNTVYANVGTFGVDLERPSIVADPTSIAATGTTNNTTQDVVVAVTDTFSGPISLQFRGTVYSVLEVNADAATEVRCYADAAGTIVAAPASNICPLLTLTPLTNVGGQTEQGTIVTPTAAAGPNEGYIVLDVQGVDRAGNTSATTLTFTTLNDITAPGAVINIITTNNLNGTTELTGQIRENVDLASFDTRFTYPGLSSVPDEVPFVTPTAVDTYGLPLTGVRDVNAIASTTVRDIRDVTGAIIPATAYGFGASDVAANFSFTGQTITNTAGPGVGGLFGGAFPTDFDASFVARADAAGATNASTIDRSGTPTFPTSRTVFAQVRTTATGTNPLANVYFYIVNPGANGLFGDADDYNVLIGQQSAGSSTVVTGITDRTFTFTTTVATGVVPRIGTTNTYQVYAIGVAANGSAIMSDILALTIQD